METEKMTEKKAEPPIVSDSKTIKEKHYLWITPFIESDCECNDTGIDVDHYTFEIPGVKRENIQLQIVKEGLRLTADRTDGYTYVSELGFECPAKVEEVKAHYENGILGVDVGFQCEDPFRDGKVVKIE